MKGCNATTGNCGHLVEMNMNMNCGHLDVMQRQERHEHEQNFGTSRCNETIGNYGHLVENDRKVSMRAYLARIHRINPRPIHPRE